MLSFVYLYLTAGNLLRRGLSLGVAFSVPRRHHRHMVGVFACASMCRQRWLQSFQESLVECQMSVKINIRRFLTLGHPRA